MVEKKEEPTTIDEYIAQFPEDKQAILAKIRAVIHETAPEAVEKISYKMPSFQLNGGLIWFAANKKHIGIYPNSSSMKANIPELAGYKGTKGSVHFSLNEPMPYDLLRKIVQVRLAENLAAAKKADKKG